MSLVALEGAGFWVPTPHATVALTIQATSDSMLLDANGEEGQFIGTVTIDGGGSKTFGTSSKIGWLVGLSASFAAGATLRVGMKHTAQVVTTAGPPARATLGTAAFNVWDDLVGGTDTLSVLTWREETMTGGTPLTVTDGDMLAICFHLSVSSGTPIIAIRGVSAGTIGPNMPISTLVTGGSTYTSANVQPNLILVFDDGTLGWLELSKIVSGSGDTATSAIGNGNSLGNIVQIPFPCQIDALMAYVAAGSTGDFALELWSTPLGTPSLMASVPADANVQTASTGRPFYKRLPIPQTLVAHTDYAISIKQTTANSVTTAYFEVPNAAYFKPLGLGADCYGAQSPGGATFVADTTGRRRYYIWMRVSALDDGTSGEPSAGGGGSVFGAAGGVIS